MRDTRNANKIAKWMVACGLAAAVAVIPACAPSDPMAELEEKAAAKLQELTSANQDYHVYGLQLAGRCDSPATFDLLVEASRSTGYDVSYQGLQGLVDRNPEAARQALREAFDSKRGALKQVSALGLAQLGEADAIAWLKEQVEQTEALPSPDVLLFLARSGDPELAKKKLAAGVGSNQESVRDEAYAVLGALGEPWATQLLLQGLDREHGERRREAIVALGKTGDPAVAPRIAKFANTQGLVLQTLHALGALGNPESAAVLEKACGREEELVQVCAGAAIWKLGDAEKAEEVLGPLVHGEQKFTRLKLAEELGSVDEDLARGMLAALTDDAEKEVRRAAYLGLLEQGGEGLVPVFTDGAQDAEYEVATLAIEGLGRWGDADSLAVLEPLLDHENPYVAITAATAILEIRSREADAPAA